MKRNESIGDEYLRHEQRLENIKVFFDLMDRLELKPGDEFVERHTESNLYCVSIDFDNLSIECSSTKKKIYTEMDLIHMDIDDLRNFLAKTLEKK